MQDAPQGATFIWCNNTTSYPRDIARRVGREDLRIEPLDVLLRGNGDRLRGRDNGIVLDHYASELMMAEHWRGWHELEAWHNRRKSA